MKEEEFYESLRGTGLTDAGVALLKRIWKGDPVRQSRGKTSNVRGRFPSETMQKMLGSDSRTCEATFLGVSDADPAIRAILDQPTQLKVKPLTKEGTPWLYIPDFLILENGKWVFIECKPLEKFDKMMLKHPGRYIREGDSLRCPAIEAAAAAYGIGFRFWTPEKHQVCARNLSFLRTYMRGEKIAVPAEEAEKVLAILRSRSRIVLCDLLRESEVKADFVFSLIADGTIYVDLNAAPLAHLGEVFVYPSAERAHAINAALGLQGLPNIPVATPVKYEAGEAVVWDGKLVRITIATPTTVHLEDAGKLTTFPRENFASLVAKGVICGTSSVEHPAVCEASGKILEAKDAELAEAKMRLEAVNGGDCRKSARSLSRWKKKARESQDKWGNPLVALIDNNRKKGNREPRNKEFIEPAAAVIKDFYGTGVAPSGKAAHAELEARLKAAGHIKFPSYAWFLSQTKKKPQKKLTWDRDGSRVAYSLYGFRYAEGDWIPPHGDYPWHVGHIDHTQGDVAVEVSPDLPLMRPWITRYWLSWCRYPVAHVIRFTPPNKEAVLAVMRVCIERHGRLADINVVDNGKDLLGTDCQKFAAKVRLEFWIRPPAEARSGSIVEAGNRSLDAHVLHNIPGSTRALKRARQVTKTVNPWNLPVCHIEDVAALVEEYLYEIIPNTIHPELMMTPLNKMNEGLKLLGERENAKIVMDEELYLLSMPLVPGEICKVQKGGAVKFNHTWYYCKLLKEGQSVETRLDPLDQSHVFTKIDGKFVEARSPQTAEYLKRQTYNRQVASALLRAAKGIAVTLRSRGIAQNLQPHIAALNGKAKMPGTEPAPTPPENNGCVQGGNPSALKPPANLPRVDKIPVAPKKTIKSLTTTIPRKNNDLWS